MYYAILSEADCIEVFPDEETRNAMLCYYYDIEFKCTKLDINVSHRGELEAWLEQENLQFPDITLEFANPRETSLQLEVHRLMQRIDTLEDALVL